MDDNTRKELENLQDRLDAQRDLSSMIPGKYGSGLSYAFNVAWLEINQLLMKDGSERSKDWQ
jgi:hypothetical protein